MAAAASNSRLLALLGIAIGVFFLSAPVTAGVIDNFPEQRLLTALGEEFAPYYAQTFRALPGFADDLVIVLEGFSGPDNVEFHVLLTDVIGSGPIFHPTDVLFESGTVSFDSAAPRTVLHIGLLPPLCGAATALRTLGERPKSQ